MPHKTLKGLLAFTTILTTAACAFGDGKQLSTISYSQNEPYNQFLVQSGGSQRLPTGCVPTAFSELMAYHQWPVVVDDDFYCASILKGSWMYRTETDNGAYSLIDWDLINKNQRSGEFDYQIARLFSLVQSFAVTAFGDAGSAAYIISPHFNPWYENPTNYNNSNTPSSERDEIFSAIRTSIDNNLPVVASCLLSKDSGHAIVVDGYGTTDGVDTIHCNYGWGPGANRNNTLTADRDRIGGFYLSTAVPGYAPRKMTQIRPLPVVSSVKPTIEWYAPRYWTTLAPNESDRISAYEVEVRKAKTEKTTWRDNFAQLATTVMQKSHGLSSDVIKDGNIYIVEDNELKFHPNPEPRFYEWPQSWVATDTTRLTFKDKLYYAENVRGWVQVKVGNQPWRTIHRLDESVKGERDWKTAEIDLGGYAGLPVRFRIYVMRISNSGVSNAYVWRFKDWTLSDVREFETVDSFRTADRMAKLEKVNEQNGIYEMSVKPVIGNQVYACYRTVTTKVGPVSETPVLTVTCRGEQPDAGRVLRNAYPTPEQVTVSSSKPLKELIVKSAHESVYPQSGVSVTSSDKRTWTVTLTPDADFFTAPASRAKADGQRVLFTIAGIEESGEATYSDVIMEFTSVGTTQLADNIITHGVATRREDFYLPAADDDEWILTLGADSAQVTDWDEADFTKGLQTCKGSALPASAKVRVLVTDTNFTTDMWNCKSIRFSSAVRVDTLSIQTKDCAAAALNFRGGRFAMTCNRLNVANTYVINGSIVKTTELWVGYDCTVVMPGGDWDEILRKISGTGTIELQQNPAYRGIAYNDYSNFYGYIKGHSRLTPENPPDPSIFEESGDSDKEEGEGDSGGGSTGGGDSTGGDPMPPPSGPNSGKIPSIDNYYGYDMSENYFDARKQAIRDHKLLFVLSGSISCNYCSMTKAYLQNNAATINPRYVCYYAKLQNNGGKSPFQGGLPQYGTYDPRTIDAFTGCYDEANVYQPQLAWYSGWDNAFLSWRGYSADLIKQCLDAAEEKTGGKPLGNFIGFRLEGPTKVIAGTPTKYTLYADFDDKVSMVVDHGLEWSFVGSASVDAKKEGFVTASGNQTEVTIRCHNAFYDFGVDNNIIEKTIAVTDQNSVKDIVIDQTPFNLEDNPKVILKAKAVLTDGNETDIVPTWSVRIKSFVDLPQDAPIPERKDIAVEMTGSGEVRYKKEENRYYGINAQDHILEVTASIGGKTVTKDIRVYGPSRLWASKWTIPTDQPVAPGSVIKANVTELKYTYKGEVKTTSDLKYADFMMEAYFEGYYSTVNHQQPGAMVDIPANFNITSGGQMKIRLYARRKGGKYTGSYDCAYPNNTIDQRVVAFKSPTRYVEDRNGIRVNNGWVEVHFPGQTFDRALLDADADGDGYTNAEEFLLGTNPNDPTDCWKFTACHFDWPDNVYYRVMFMNTQYPGRVYTIEGKENWNDEWSTLGVMKGEEPGVITQSNVAKADKCHYFRVSAEFTYPIGKGMSIPALGVYPGPKGKEVSVTIKPADANNCYPAFAVDANNLTYPIYVDVTPVEGETVPLFSVTTNEVEHGQLNRFALPQKLTDEGWFLVHKTEGVWERFYTTKTPSEVSVIPGKVVAISAESKEAALAIGRLALTDSAAVKAGQAKVVKLVATQNAAGKWALSVAIDDEAMPVKIDDTVAALGKALSSLSLQPKARAATTSIEIPAESVTPGLYYSVLCADGLDFARVDESPRVLATGGSVTLTIPAGNAPTRFFKAKASMTQSAE